MTIGPEETLQGVLERYTQEGFTGQFGARQAGQLRCFTCGNDLDPAKARLHALHRLEGASDPGDEMAVAALECPRCGAKGTIAMSYGPSASIEDALVLKAMTDTRRAATIRPGV
ncbi:MAG: hypothetical protein QOI63_1656 [Thermoplasmata archaeon]|nr:hypothetical protein [Thermoplasmata archaeon]